MGHAIKLADYTAPAWRINQVALTFRLLDDYTEVEALLSMSGDPSQPVVLDGQGLDTQWVRISGASVACDETAESLTLTAPAESFELHTLVHIKPRENTALEGLYVSGDMYCTQCEAEGFRRITWFLDRPDNLAVWNVTIDAPLSLPTLLSNGNRVSEVTTEDGRRLVAWEDPHPKPSYLFALVAGDLECRKRTFATASERKVDIHIYTRAADIDKTEYAMECVVNAMRWDEERFGREYDLDLFQIVAVHDFNMGAMENKGLNIFNTAAVLATPEIATDDAFERVEAIIGHEYFHNWSGNRVTCRDWFQLSLKEGFTVYRDAEFTSDLRSRGVKRIQDVDFLRTHQFSEDQSPTKHPVRPAEYEEISNFYTVTIYEKGAEVVRMLATLLGAGDFRRACDLYFERFDGQAATCDDFVACMSEVSGRDLTQFMHWYSQAGTPRVQVAVEQVEDAWQAKVTQVPAVSGQNAFHIPLQVQAYDREGQVIVPGQLWELTETAQSFPLGTFDEKPVLSINQGFTAPVIVEYHLEPSERLMLASSDQDPVNRWDAGRQLVEEHWLAHLGQGMLEELGPLSDLFKACIDTALSTPALAAETFTLPDPAVILNRAGSDVDPLEVYEKGQQLEAATGASLGVHLHSLLGDLAPQDEYAPVGTQASRRKLWARVAKFLAQAKDESIAPVLEQRFIFADNLTDRLNAMNCAAILNPALFNRMTTVFKEDWQHEPLLNDQWFSLKARHGNVDDVKALLALEDFDLKNPNRVRSVMGPFMRSNYRAFHGAGGYALAGDVVAELDALNPQIAARLVLPLTRFEHWAEPFKQRAVEVLEGLAVRAKSKDLNEVLAKALNPA